jgi:hypothetical protein
MITTKFDNGRVFIHNGDYSGDLIINADPDEVAKVDYDSITRLPGWHVTIPFEDIKAIVAEYVRRQRAIELENATDDDVLFGRVRSEP